MKLNEPRGKNLSLKGNLYTKAMLANKQERMNSNKTALSKLLINMEQK